MKEKIKTILGLLMFLSFVVFTVVIVFSNPDMTEMRLLITIGKCEKPTPLGLGWIA